MQNRNLFTLSFIAIGFILCACSSSRKSTASSNATTLKEAYKNDFLVGAALNAEQIEEKNAKAAALILHQFSALTPENIMKCEIIHPQWDKYNFDLADKLIAYGQKNNIPIVGHTLIWHSQLSPFVRNIKSADSLKQFFSDHITTIAARYDGKIKGWDVVNEAVEEDGSMRKSIFLNLLGEDFVAEAFRLAQKAAPNTELYYNDYNIEQPKKRAGTIALIKKIQAAGVRIDGVGIQGHWHTGKVPFKDIEESILEYAALGLKVMFTEVDLEVLPRNFQGADVNQRTAENPALNPYKDGLPDSVLQQQSWDYENLFRLFLKYKNQIDRVTFWGVNDGQSWLNNWPVRGRTNYPLLFDRQFNPKPAYNKLLELKKNDTLKKTEVKKPA